jgi:hypothetical protein
MESGDYAGFLAENRAALITCGAAEDCDVPLFNLGFLHAFPKSPYLDQAKALKYFEELVQRYPKSARAYEAKAWSEIMKQKITAEKKRRELQDKIKTRDAAITDLQEQVKRVSEKEAEITDLQERIKRSSEIDLQIEQKERELGK